MTAGGLQRVIHRARRRMASAERCGLCAAGVGPEHRHVWDEQDGELVCACPACALLFAREAAGGGRYQLVPARGRRVSGLTPGELGVPVGLAFFVTQRDGRVLAHYPGPLGATAAEVDAGAWRAAAAQVTALAGLKPQVEALLVWTGTPRDGDQQWVVPVDECFRLVAVIRQHWTGMSGGSAVWREIAGFFDDLGRRHERPATTDGRGR